VHLVGQGRCEDYGAAGLVEGEAAGVGYSLFLAISFSYLATERYEGEGE